MNKNSNVSNEELALVSQVTEKTSRREFFKKTAAYSVSALAVASIVGCKC